MEMPLLFKVSPGLKCLFIFIYKYYLATKNDPYRLPLKWEMNQSK